MEENHIDKLIDVLEGLDLISAIGYLEATKVVLIQYAQQEESDVEYTN